MGKGDTHAPLDVRLWRRVDAAGPCWLWLGATRNGYGVISLGGQGDGMGYVHRVAWELLVGEIPEGLTIDHLCRVKRCVNPDHLETVTLAENVSRRQARHVCRRGHRDWYIHAKTGYRQCRPCNTERQRRRRRRS